MEATDVVEEETVEVIAEEDVDVVEKETTTTTLATAHGAYEVTQADGVIMMLTLTDQNIWEWRVMMNGVPLFGVGEMSNEDNLTPEEAANLIYQKAHIETVVENARRYMMVA